MNNPETLAILRHMSQDKDNPETQDKDKQSQKQNTDN